MAKYCTQCGRPLADGEVCQCQLNAAGEKERNNGQKMNYQQGYAQTGGAQNTYQQTGRASGANKGGAKNAAGQDSITISTEDWIPFRKLIGIGESDNNDVTGCFERGKKVVPDLVAPCEQEIPVKQYHICNARSRLRGLWQEGKIQVTNKRVLFRLSGRSWIGKAMSHIEFTIDEVAGISISNGVRFGLWDFIIGMLLSGIVMGIGCGIGNIPALLAYILGIALAVPFFMFKKKYFIKSLCLAAGVGMLSTSSVRLAWEHAFLSKLGIFFMLILFILFVVALFLFALKPSLSISVMTKCASDEPIHIWSQQTMVSIMEILPGEDADVAIEELGSMITDIQKLGDFGIKKWKED